MLFLQLAEFWKDILLWNPKPLSAVFTLNLIPTTNKPLQNSKHHLRTKLGSYNKYCSFWSIFHIDKTNYYYYRKGIGFYKFEIIVGSGWNTMISSNVRSEIMQIVTYEKIMMAFNNLASYFHENLFHYFKDQLITKLTLG
jgi:hypothetical protein